MTCFVIIAIGESPESARPLIARSDPELLKHTLSMLGVPPRTAVELTRSGDDIKPADLAKIENFQWTDADVDFELRRAAALEKALGADSWILTEELAALAAWHRQRASVIAELALAANAPR